MQESSNATKQTLSRAYESTKFNEAMDEALHPGGLELSARLAEIAGITSNSQVLDISSGRGTTPSFLARQFGCRIAGVDLSYSSTSLAAQRAGDEGLLPQLDFLIADAELIPFSGSSFDVVISECSFSLLPDKESGAREIARVLKPGGKFVFTDVILKFPLSAELLGDLTFECCFSSAETQEGYRRILAGAGLREEYFEDHSKTLKKATYQVITGYGSLAAFWEQFGSAEPADCPVVEGDPSSRKLWIRMFQEGKPGYGLFSFIKS
ncbi:MAG: class I SAM-dependent methyltransferase [Dehalococcoidia bacterium]